MTEKRPIEDKVIGATGGGLIGYEVVADFVLWVEAQLWWHGNVAAIPGPVHDFTTGVIIAALTFLGGFVLRHTPRPDLGTDDVAPVDVEPLPTVEGLEAP